LKRLLDLRAVAARLEGQLDEPARNCGSVTLLVQPRMTESGREADIMTQRYPLSGLP